jgi:hypothetical protein
MRRYEQLVARGRDIIQQAPQLYIDLDVEADGIPGYGSLLSIGAVSPYGETFYTELQPSSEKYLLSNRSFAEAHSLERERLLREGEEPQSAIRNLARWAMDLTELRNKDKPVLAAFNASFDFPWVDLAMKEAGIQQIRLVSPAFALRAWQWHCQECMTGEKQRKAIYRQSLYLREILRTTHLRMPYTNNRYTLPLQAN